jgi:hypothetical protein
MEKSGPCDNVCELSIKPNLYQSITKRVRKGWQSDGEGIFQTKSYRSSMIEVHLEGNALKCVPHLQAGDRV